MLSSRQEVFDQELSRKMLQNSQENTCDDVLSYRSISATLLRKDAIEGVFL